MVINSNKFIKYADIGIKVTAICSSSQSLSNLAGKSGLVHSTN